jgi:hypothetical protein
MTIQEAILDLFIACGAQELSEIVDECRNQVTSTTVTVSNVLNALEHLSATRKIRREIVSTGDRDFSPSFTAWGLPSDF